MLVTVLMEEQPQRYLVIGDPAPLDPYPEGHTAQAACPVYLPLQGATDALPEHGRQDLVLVGGLERLSRAEGEILLSRLRDLYARRVLVCLALGDTWRQNDLTAFAFTRLATLGDGMGTLYGFDVGTYKTTPDWLNPRYWANPELWGKYRW